jgi:hypothetical protein
LRFFFTRLVIVPVLTRCKPERFLERSWCEEKRDLLL